MANRLEVRLLGNFEAEAANGHVAPFEAATARALLAYLAANRTQPQLRSALATVLWGADVGATGLTNLRSALRRVRNAVTLEDGVTSCLWAGRDTVQINPAVTTVVDAEQFEVLLRAVQQHEHIAVHDCAVCAERQRQAVLLYRGDFLADLDLPNEQFEQWRSLEQERYRRAVVGALGNLVEYEMRRGSLDEAERLARRQLVLEPWNEEAHRQLMRVLLATGQRSAALAQYELCCQVLEAELGVAPAAETDALRARILTGMTQPARRTGENPYKSLEAFGAADAGYFFGRERVVAQLAAAVCSEPLVALIGPSGSGKSSVIHAGLLPALLVQAAGGHSIGGSAARWLVGTLRPGSQPLGALAEALPALGVAALPPDALAELLLQGQTTLAALVAAAGTAHAGTQTPDGAGALRRLLIVDQFEEIFTLCHDTAARAAFLRCILSGLPGRRGDGTGTGSTGDTAVTVLLAMRADFLGEALQDGQLAAALQQHALLLGPMDRREVQRAIEEPARLQGAMFEPGLVERLLDDVGSEPGRLPMLQFALAMLWLRQQDGWLTHAIYDEIGGVRGALAEYTDEVYLHLSLPEQQAARGIFLSLVEGGLNAQDVRRLATRAEIGANRWPIVQRLADARLLVTNTNSDDEEIAELAHEALIREWKRLRDWLAADRVFRSWQQQMRLAAEHWRQGEHDENVLLGGSRLAEAERWLADRHGDVNPSVRRYVEASFALRDRRQAEEAARRQNELAQAQALAAAEHARAEFELAARLRLRRLTIGVALATLVAVAAAVFAVWAQRTAEHNAHVAHSRQVIAQAINAMQAQPDLALLLAVEALQLDDSPESRMALYSELDVHPLLARILHGEPAPLYSLGLRGDQAVLASNEQGAVIAWDVISGEQRALADDGAGVANAAVSPDGRRYATASGESVTVWDGASATQLFTLDGHSGEVLHLSFTRDGSRLLSADDSGRVLLSDAASGGLVQEWQSRELRPILGPVSLDGAIILLGDPPDSQDVMDMWNIVQNERVGRSLLGHTDVVHGYAASPDGSLLATASFDGSVRLWDTATGTARGEPLLGHAGQVLFAAFSPDGRSLATGGTDRQVILWDVATHGRLGAALTGHANSVRVGHFSADGSLLVTGDESGDVLLWDLSRLHVLLGHTDRIRSLALSPDETTLVTSGFDRRIIVWDAATLEERQVIETEHIHSIISVAFSPDGLTFVSVDAGGYILFWDTATWQPRFPLQQVATDVLIGLAFSPDGQTLAAGCFDGVVRLWDVATGTQRHAIPAYDTGWALSVRYDPAGEVLATGGGDGVIKLWDAASNEVLGKPLVGHSNRVTDLLFAEDGGVLVSASMDGSIRFWDVATGAAAGEPLIARGDQVWSIRTTDGDPQRLLALHRSGAIADWDMTTYTLNRPLVYTHVETEEMTSAVEGDLAYIASTGPQAQALALRTDDWAAEACRIANRTLSDEEWRKYMRDLPYDPACR